ncbi:MAG: TetR/AcrR family transcriptional regulator, partial [Proteobacteria bacterium]|nr:TetR/AcrR family transcriptional regulator [Pseudomonadota bacterium]
MDTKKAQEKKDRILAAAEEIVSQKGLNDATISDISKKAGVADSIIYQFFKGKEDLVFSIPEAKFNEVFSQLDEHLQGIWDVESRLSKIVWFHLRYCDMHPQYAKILYFECLSNKD